jgi:hypothetical protein
MAESINLTKQRTVSALAVYGDDGNYGNYGKITQHPSKLDSQALDLMLDPAYVIIKKLRDEN